MSTALVLVGFVALSAALALSGSTPNTYDGDAAAGGLAATPDEPLPDSPRTGDAPPDR